MPTDVVGYVEVFNYISLVGVVEQLVFAMRVLDRRLHVLLELLERTDDLGLDLGYFYIVSELLDVLCGGTPEHAANKELFRGITLRATRNISEYCLKPKNGLDTPAGPRDPAYFDPGSAASDARPYQISGGGKQWI